MTIPYLILYTVSMDPNDAVKESDLPLRHRLFVDGLFLYHGNATRAAEFAGYSSTSESSLAVQGHHLLRKPNIRALVDARYRQNVMSADELMSGITSIARANIGDYIDDYGALAGIDVKRLIADGHGHLIKGLRHTKTGTEILFHDKQKAQDQLLRFYGLVSDVNVNVDNRHVKVSYVVENRDSDGRQPGASDNEPSIIDNDE